MLLFRYNVLVYGLELINHFRKKRKMMRKIITLLLLSVSLLLASINLQTASKVELMSIKGIGPKKADQIIEYRKTNVLQSANDLKDLKGFGEGLISNINKADTTFAEISEKKKLK